MIKLLKDSRQNSRKVEDQMIQSEAFGLVGHQSRCVVVSLTLCRSRSRSRPSPRAQAIQIYLIVILTIGRSNSLGLAEERHGLTQPACLKAQGQAKIQCNQLSVLCGIPQGSNLGPLGSSLGSRLAQAREQGRPRSRSRSTLCYRRK